MTSFDSALLNVCVWLARIGSLLVIVGCCLEAAELIIAWVKKKAFRKWVGEIFEKSCTRKLVFLVKIIEPRVLKFETLGFFVLCIGLAMELGGSFEAERIQSAENDRLTKQLDSTTKQAGDAKIEAGQANVRAALIESNNLVLRSNVAVLEASVQWRTISPTQETNLILAIKPLNKDVLPASKRVVVLLYNSSDIEAWTFADRIVEVLKKCDFDVEIKSPNTPLPVNIEPFPGGLIFIWGKNEKIPENFSAIQWNFLFQGWVPVPYPVTAPIPEGVFEILVSYKKPKK